MEVFEKYRSEAAVVNNPEVKKIKEDIKDEKARAAAAKAAAEGKKASKEDKKK